MKKWTFVIAFIGMISSLSFSQEEKYPKPVGWVNDFARVIPSDYRERMNLIIDEVRRKTGVEIAVVTIDNMGGATIEDYANHLFQNWGIGRKEKDNGILFLLALEERKVRIEVGYDLEGILPDGLVGDILDTYALPDFQSGNYGMGFYRSLAAVVDIIAKDVGIVITGSPRIVQRTRTSGRSSAGGIFFIIIFVLLMIVTRGRILPWILFALMMGGGGRGGGFSGGGGFGGSFGGFGGGMSGGGGASRGF